MTATGFSPPQHAAATDPVQPPIGWMRTSAVMITSWAREAARIGRLCAEPAITYGDATQVAFHVSTFKY
jgi:hypothetical protein